MKGGRAGVILLQMGGPEALGDIRSFLANLFADPAIMPLPGPKWLKRFLAGRLAAGRASRVRRRYEIIGGGSPIGSITREQAAALEAWLRDEGRDVPVRVAMRYTPPRAADAVAELKRAGVTRFLGLSLYPQYSTATTASSVLDLEQALGAESPSLTVIDSWARHPGYVELLAGWINGEADRFKKETGHRPLVVFSAHGLPERLVRRGDPYQDETEATVSAVAAGLGDLDWRLAYQSAVGPVKWIGPATGETIRELGKEGVAGILVVPVSFVSDHIETLYDMDLVYRETAREAGVAHYRRCPAFNADPSFIRMLGGLVVPLLPA